MEVKIISEDIIKPSSPISLHQRTHKLSLLDQLHPPCYIPIIHFYSPVTSENCNKISNRLKQSFSETLTHFYPLAGRTNDGLLCIDCNDDGALYSEAHVPGDMSVVLQEPDMDKLAKLLPCNPHEISSEISSQVLLKAQVNYFDCGGIAISVCVWHVVADASATASFVTSWAEIASGVGCKDLEEVVTHCTSLFPPRDIKSSPCLLKFMNQKLLIKILMKRFLFDRAQVAALREELGNGPGADHPTRVEAVAALIWGSLMAATGEAYAARIVANLRKRINPPLPNKSIGNIYQLTVTNCSKNENIQDFSSLARKIHESIKIMNNDNIRMIHSIGAYYERVRKASEEFGKNPELLKIINFSSWCRFPFYKADFGWGEPLWVSTALKQHKVALFLDTKDGQGIEAWIGLPKEDMAKFEKTPGIVPMHYSVQA